MVGVRAAHMSHVMRTMMLLLLVVCCGLPGMVWGADGACRGATSRDVLTNLQIYSGNENAILMWEYPEGVCFLSFVVSATELDGSGQDVKEAASFETTLRNTLVPKLKNGIPYRFDVQVKYARDAFGPSISNTTIPSTPCKQKGEPGPVKGLSVVRQTPESVEICWSAPEDGVGCVDEYIIGKRMKPRNDAEAFSEEFEWTIRKTALPGCHTFTDHELNRPYEYGVQAYNAPSQIGGEAKVVNVYVADSWRCLPLGTYYPTCQAAKDGVCEALDCSEIAAQDKCDLPSVRKYDALRKTVVQYCSSVCPCDVPDEEEIAVIDELEWMDFQSPLLGDDICCA
ncbi:hypothetical protein M9435_004264 [Picochlorum sp. BPE23]|nr:hypothetical protein M9435_004264 [Picochlorum sp. BPE23]